MSVATGQIVARKYRIDRLLGEGGMGVVVAATHLALDRKVALKFMLPSLGADRSVAARFLREAQAAARLQGEHVTRVLDFGTLDDGAPFMAMELLEGEDLAEVVHRDGPLAVAVACDHLLQVCVALAEAHALGIVHRDIKPANLFLTRSADGGPLVKVLDFGISKVGGVECGGVALTHTGSILGSPRYMSPEQLRSTKDVDPRADIWALGITLYELVTGDVPFQADSFSALCVQVATEPPPAIEGSGFNFRLNAIVRRCLEKDAGARYPDVAALASALAALASPRGRALAARVRATLGAPDVHVRTARIRRRGRRGALFALIAAAAALATVLLLGLRSRTRVEVPRVEMPDAGILVVIALPVALPVAPAEPPDAPAPVPPPAAPAPPASPAPPAPTGKPHPGPERLPDTTCRKCRR